MEILLVGLLIPFLGTTFGSAMVFFMKNKINNKIEKLYSKQKEYEKLIQEIENDKFKVNRKNIELIEKIFLENNSLEDRKLIEEIMENEIENYNDRIKKSKRKEEKKLAEEDLIQVFNKYDYKYKHKIPFTKGEKYFFRKEEIRKILQELSKKRL